MALLMKRTVIRSDGKDLGYADTISSGSLKDMVAKFGEEGVIKLAISQANANICNQARAGATGKGGGKPKASVDFSKLSKIG